LSFTRSSLIVTLTRGRSCGGIPFADFAMASTGSLFAGALLALGATLGALDALDTLDSDGDGAGVESE
jgi:hypothetical protein